MATLAELEVLVEEIIGRGDKTSFIATHVNRAQLELALQYNLRGLVDIRSYTMTADQQVQAFDSDYLRTLRLFMKDTTNEKGRLLVPVSPKKYYDEYYYPAKATSTPTLFAIDYTRWLLSPPATEGLLLEATIVRSPLTVSVTQDSVIVNGDDAIAWLGAAFLLATLEEFEHAAAKLGVAMAHIDKLVAGQQTQIQTVDGFTHDS